MSPTKPPELDPKRVVGYVRASTDRQDLSPHAQRHALVEWCEAHDATLVEVYTDEGVSGGAPIDKRPGLLMAVGGLREHRAGVLLVARRCRLTRDVVVGAMVERLVQRRGGRIVSANGVGNGSGPEAQLMRRIVDAVAEYKRSLIRVRTRAVKARRGERVGGIPYGSTLSADGNRLLRNPKEQKLISLACELRGQGLSLRAVA